MTKITKTYLSGCTWCNATGFVKEPFPTTTGGLTQVCPVCNGNKTIIVTETTDDNWLEQINKMIPKTIL